MKSLQFVGAEFLVQLFRVAESSGLWKGRGFDFLPGKSKPSGPSKPTRDLTPATSTPSQRPDHPPCSDFNFLGQIDPRAGRVPEGRQIVAHRGIGGQT